MDKPTVLYTETNPIIVGEQAYIIAHNHPRYPDRDEWHARTSTVLAYDIITGEIETLNTIYKIKVELKSVSKSDHAVVQDDIAPNKWIHKVPLTTEKVEEFSNNIKHDLEELGYTFKYITCDKCDIKSTCKLAFDIYNTDGDCLLK